MGESRSIQWITFYTGSALGEDPCYAQAVAEVATELAHLGFGVVYGGGRVGLMGVLADAALAAGGEVIGIMPQALVDSEIAHTGLTRLETVSDMTERKLRMGELGDAFVTLPGGAGTCEEFFEAWTWQQLGIHAKPVALYNTKGFWDPLLTSINAMVDTGFVSKTFADALIVTDTPAGLLEAFATWQAPPKKWQN